MADIKSLPIELQKVAETELNEVPARIASDLEDLKTWINQEPHLKARLDDQFLAQFLRGCKFSLEKSKKKIDLFFTLKTKFPDLFNAIDVNETKFRNNYKRGFGIPLPQPINDNGSRIYFMKYDGNIGKGLIAIEDLFVVINAMHEILIMDDPYASINGVVYILDCKDFSVNMAAKFTPSFLKKLAQFYENCLPFRIKGIHIINMPGFVHGILSIVMPLLSEKLRNRIFIYGENFSSMEKIIPKKYLPVHLGGENGLLDQLLKDFDEKWLEYTNYFHENANLGTNEVLRLGKPIDFDSVYGLGGSFRKLDVD